MVDFPPTIIVVHPKERISKCTALPLRGKPGFIFWKYPHLGDFPSNDYVRLGFGGQLLSRQDRDRGLLVLDGTWRLVNKMESSFGESPVRSLPAWKTAYPRVSKIYEEPCGGLATVEAIFAAYTILGRETDWLLDDYRQAEAFRWLNRDRL